MSVMRVEHRIEKKVKGPHNPTSQLLPIMIKVPRLPRKATLDVAKCHACYANSGVCGQVACVDVCEEVVCEEVV